MSRLPRVERRWLVLTTMAAALGILTIDATIVRVALPSIQHDLAMSDVAEQWLVNAYLLTTAAFVIAGGRAGDLFGRRRVFIAGLATFTACSAVAGFADSDWVLLAARAGQGVGAAVMLPGTIAIVTDAFAGPALGGAIAVLTMAAAIGVSIAPLLGGSIAELAGWRWIFYVNLPIGLVVAVAVLATVPESRRPKAPPLDVLGLALLAGGLTALILGLMQMPDWGWASPATIGLHAAAVVMLALFGLVERRATSPLVDLRLLRGRSLAANTIGACSQFVVTGLTVLVAVYLQTGLGYSPVEAGALLLPITVPMLFSAPLTGHMLMRVGVRALVTTGMGLMAGGMVAVGIAAHASERYVAHLPGLVLFGLGFAAVYTALTTAVMGSAPAFDRGLVSGVYNTARNLGATLGLAVMGTLLAAFEGHRLTTLLPSGEAGAIDDKRVQHLLGTEDLSAGGAHLQSVARTAFEGAFAITVEISASVALAGALIAYFALGRLPAASEVPDAGPRMTSGKKLAES
jgi:EmrB/QacA subfamily drug resistance transporter